MPSGSIKWFDPTKGFGFITEDSGQAVYFHKSALPAGVATLMAGQRIEFGVADAVDGPQAMSIELVDPHPSSRLCELPPRWWSVHGQQTHVIGLSTNVRSCRPVSIIRVNQSDQPWASAA